MFGWIAKHSSLVLIVGAFLVPFLVAALIIVAVDNGFLLHFQHYFVWLLFLLPVVIFSILLSHLPFDVFNRFLLILAYLPTEVYLLIKWIYFFICAYTDSCQSMT